MEVMNVDDTGEVNDNRDCLLQKTRCQSRGPRIDFHQSWGQCTGGAGPNGPREAARGKILPSAFKELLKSSGTRMIKVRYDISFNKKHYAALSPVCGGTL